MKTTDFATDNKVGRKTPEEIKKGLEYCYSTKPCIDCKYDQRDFPHCVRRLLKDASDGYRQLESYLAQVKREMDTLAAALEGDRFCGDCLHLYSKDQGSCLSCSQDRERSKPLWQWRGPCPENTKEDPQ